MRVVQSREMHTNKRTASGIKNPIPVGNMKPHNCKTPCPYGNGTTFCFPCMAKILDERRQKDTVRPVQENNAQKQAAVKRQAERLSQYGKKLEEAASVSTQAKRLAAYAGRLVHE